MKKTVISLLVGICCFVLTGCSGIKVTLDDAIYTSMDSMSSKFIEINQNEMDIIGKLQAKGILPISFYNAYYDRLASRMNDYTIEFNEIKNNIKGGLEGTEDSSGLSEDDLKKHITTFTYSYGQYIYYHGGIDEVHSDIKPCSESNYHYDIVSIMACLMGECSTHIKAAVSDGKEEANESESKNETIIDLKSKLFKKSNEAVITIEEEKSYDLTLGNDSSSTIEKYMKDFVSAEVYVLNSELLNNNAKLKELLEFTSSININGGKLEYNNESYNGDNINSILRSTLDKYYVNSGLSIENLIEIDTKAYKEVIEELSNGNGVDKGLYVTGSYGSTGRGSTYTTDDNFFQYSIRYKGLNEDLIEKYLEAIDLINSTDTRLLNIDGRIYLISYPVYVTSDFIIGPNEGQANVYAYYDTNSLGYIWIDIFNHKTYKDLGILNSTQRTTNWAGNTSYGSKVATAAELDLASAFKNLELIKTDASLYTFLDLNETDKTYELGSFIIGSSSLTDEFISNNNSTYRTSPITVKFGTTTLPVICLRDYIELTYVPSVAEEELVAFGRRIRLVPELFDYTKGVHRSQSIGKYTDSLSNRININISDIASLTWFKEDSSLRYFTTGYNKAGGEYIAASTSTEIYSASMESILRGKDKLAQIKLSGDINNNQFVSNSITVSSANSLNGRVNQKDFTWSDTYVNTGAFPGYYLANRSNVQGDAPIYYGLLVIKDYNASGLKQWLESEDSGSGLKWWSQYLQENNFS